MRVSQHEVVKEKVALFIFGGNLLPGGVEQESTSGDDGFEFWRRELERKKGETQFMSWVQEDGDADRAIFFGCEEQHYEA